MLAVLLILSMFIPVAKANMKINLVVKNSCPYSVKFTWSNTDPAGSIIASESRELNTNSTFSLTQNKNINGFIKYYDQKNIEHGALVFHTAEKVLRDNIFEVKAIRGNIDIDQENMKWHNWYGTPSFTVTACPSTIDVQHSQIFSDIERVLIFGDSLSDTGLLHNTTWGLVPKSLPYYNGAFSNGEVWSLLLKNELKGKIPVSNYAIGGATAHFSVSHLIRYTLKEEVEKFARENANNEWKNQKKFLALVFMGANDYLDRKNMQAAEQKAYVDKVIASIHSAVKSLMNRGIKKIALISLPDVGLTPECSQDYKNQKLVSHLSLMHNNRLLDLVNSYKRRYPGTDYEFIYVNLMGIISQIVNETEQFNRRYQLHITNVADSCWKGGYYAHNKQKMGKRNKMYSILEQLPYTADIRAALQVSANEGNLCSDPESYLFWDRVHPTAQVHEAIYKIMKNSLGVKTIQQLASYKRP